MKRLDRLDKAIAQYARMQGYTATIRSSRVEGRVRSGVRSGEIIRYAWQRPGRIRMDFEKPHKGARLVYDPATDRVRLWPFGGALLPPMNLSPDNPLIQSPTGQRVDRSDVGTLLENIRALSQGGSVETLGAETIGGRETTHVAVTGKRDETLGKVHRYDAWFDDETHFPLKVVSRGLDGDEIESVLMEDVVIDPDFPLRYFDP